MRNLMKVKVSMMLLWGLISLFSIQTSWAFTASSDAKEKENIDLEGKWEEGRRSVLEDCPIAASFDASYLYVENQSERSTLIIQVKNNGVTVIEETVAVNTPSFMIPINSLEEGSLYMIEVTNQWGDLLVGAFTL